MRPSKTWGWSGCSPKRPPSPVLGDEGVQIGTAFLPCAASGASEVYRSALSSFAANGTDLTDAFTGRLARGIRNRLMKEFRHVSSPPLPFPVQHALTQTVATPASAQGALELMTIWAGQNACLCHPTDATEFMTRLIAEAEQNVTADELIVNAEVCDFRFLLLVQRLM